MEPIQLESKGKVCYIKANKQFTLKINDFEFPAPLEYNGNKYKYMLTAEYAWYKVGEDERACIRKAVEDSYSQQCDNEKISKMVDILKYRSPTETQLKWIELLNKCRIPIPQPFWNFDNASDVTITPIRDYSTEEFKYKIGLI